MKVKLYCVQEVINASDPNSCVGELSVFTTEEDRNWFFVSKMDNEYCSYQTFEKEIEL